MSAPKPFPWRSLAVASVVINLLLVGLIAGAALGGRGGHGRGGPSEVVRARVLEQLAPADQQAVRRTLARTFFESRAERGEARTARRALAQAVVAEPYDPVAVAAAFERVRTADAAVQARFHGSVAELLGRLEPEERERVLRAVISAQGRMRAGGRGPGPGDQGPGAAGPPPAPEGPPPEEAPPLRP